MERFRSPTLQIHQQVHLLIMHKRTKLLLVVALAQHLPLLQNPLLTEIATDSEDEDSDTEFQAPSWVNSPALRELLTQQQLVDPEQVFGPIAPLQMEQVFQNKDRHKQFRPRSSSANWSGADQLTEEDRRKDREARERMMRDGGWQFHLGT